MRYVGIDPSTKTGLVILDGSGEVLQARDVKGVGDVDPRRVGTLVDQIINAVRPGDIVCIEGFAHGAKGSGVGIQYGIGYMIRDRLYRMNVPYREATPNQLKKFATGKGNANKDAMVLPIYRRWKFEHSSDNARDAFVLAKIAEALDAADKGEPLTIPVFQAEVIEAIRNPKPKPAKQAK